MSESSNAWKWCTELVNLKNQKTSCQEKQVYFEDILYELKKLFKRTSPIIPIEDELLIFADALKH